MFFYYLEDAVVFFRILQEGFGELFCVEAFYEGGLVGAFEGHGFVGVFVVEELFDPF